MELKHHVQNVHIQGFQLGYEIYFTSETCCFYNEFKGKMEFNLILIFYYHRFRVHSRMFIQMFRENSP